MGGKVGKVLAKPEHKESISKLFASYAKDGVITTGELSPFAEEVLEYLIKTIPDTPLAKVVGRIPCDEKTVRFL